MNNDLAPDSMPFRPIIFKHGEWGDQERKNIIDLAPWMLPELLAINESKPGNEYPFSLIYYPWLNTYYRILNEDDFISGKNQSQ